MVNWKNVIGWGMAALVVLGVVGTNMYNQQKSDGSKRNVYAIMPSTGAIAQFGKDEQKALQQSYALLKDPKFVLKFYDSEYNPSRVVSIVDQILLNDENPLIINFTSNMSYATLPALKGKGFVMAGETIEMDDLKKFNNYQRFSVQSREGVNHLANHMASKYKNIAILNSNDMYGVTGVKYFTDAAKGKDIIINRLDFENSDLSTRDIVQKLLLKYPETEAIYVSASASVAFMNIFRELKRFDFKGAVYSLPSFAQGFVIDNLGKDAEGIIFLTLEPHLENPRTPEAQAFRKFALDNGLYPNFAPIEGYDILNLVNNMINEGVSFTQKTFEDM